MSTKILFTRHKLTEEQLLLSGLQDPCVPTNIVDATDLASVNIESMDQARQIVADLRALVHPNEKLVQVYGVLPAPLRAELLHLHNEMFDHSAEVSHQWEVYEAFNISRSVEGAKPTFTFHSWLLTSVFWL